MALRDVEIDPTLMDPASELRRAEWEAIITELVDPDECVYAANADVLRVAREGDGYRMTLHDGGGAAIADALVTLADIGRTFQEYLDIVRKLGDAGAGGGYDRVDALDMAKRVTHDQGGRIILRSCRILEADLPTARRLFTLLLSLHVDTTNLEVLRHHSPETKPVD